MHIHDWLSLMLMSGLGLALRFWLGLGLVLDSLGLSHGTRDVTEPAEIRFCWMRIL